MKVLNAQNNRVKATVKINRENFRCDFILDDNLKITSLGIEGDHMLAPDDIEPKAFAQYQQTIDTFIQEQSALRFKSPGTSNHYRVNKTILEEAVSLDAGVCSEDWYPVCFFYDTNELEEMNNFFKTAFTIEEFTPLKTKKHFMKKQIFDWKTLEGKTITKVRLPIGDDGECILVCSDGSRYRVELVGPEAIALTDNTNPHPIDYEI